MRLHSILAFLCVCAGFLAYYLSPHLRLSELEPLDLEKIIPRQVSDWTEVTSDVALINPEKEKEANDIYSQILTRKYRNADGDIIMLTIAYTTDQSDNAGKQSHRPEICYPAQGFEIKDRNDIAEQFGNYRLMVRKMTAYQSGRTEPLIYWTMVGHSVALSGIEIKKAQLFYGMKGIIPDGLLFRVSTINDDEKVGQKINSLFITALLNSLEGEQLHRLSGL